MSYEACFRNEIIAADRDTSLDCHGRHLHYNYDWKEEAPEKLEEVENS